MSRHMVPVMLGLTVFPLAAIGIAAYLVVSAGPQLTAVAGAILLLSCCILVAATVAMVKLSRHEDWLWSQQDALRDLAGKSEEALSRIAAIEIRGKEPMPAGRVDEMAMEMGALRREVREAMKDLRRPAPPHDRHAEAPPPPLEPEATHEPEVQGPAPAPMPAGREQLNLMLEPVVELSTGTTTHYRALLALADGRGNMVRHEELMQKADQGGMRPALDVRMVRMSAPVLRRLRQRNPGLRIFVPMGRATLSTLEEAGRLLALLQRDGDVASGMVFEFAQQDLGRLDPAGIENLARLARSGATLALRDVYVGGLDLAALRQLGVRFLSFPPHAVDAGSGPNSNWNDFVKSAKALQIQIVVGDIKTPQQATAASKFSRYGHGPFFAPPRKVRPDAGVAPSAARSAADVA
ncbi:EAL domain-containing protein [Aestuariivirga sp.]|uniref:EAL domain-containing protein n=1 Tax=Aestuariivirga sp. TaxID=2650926 RepID=UPI003BAA3819